MFKCSQLHSAGIFPFGTATQGATSAGRGWVCTFPHQLSSCKGHEHGKEANFTQNIIMKQVVRNHLCFWTCLQQLLESSFFSDDFLDCSSQGWRHKFSSQDSLSTWWESKHLCTMFFPSVFPQLLLQHKQLCSAVKPIQAVLVIACTNTRHPFKKITK